jgi:hypothetical protein
VQRVPADLSDGKPLYLLYSGRGKPTPFLGNGALQNLTEMARSDWSDAGKDPPPKIAFGGEGELREFDAAALTMAIASRSIRFAVPDAFAEMQLIPGMMNMKRPTYTRSGDYLTGTQKLGAFSGSVTAKAKAIIAEVLAAIREYLNFNDLQPTSFTFMSPAEKRKIIDELARRAEETMRRARVTYPDDGSVSITLEIGDQSRSIEVGLQDPHVVDDRLATLDGR